LQSIKRWAGLPAIALQSIKRWAGLLHGPQTVLHLRGPINVGKGAAEALDLVQPVLQIE
jgi:hypothetical protein